MAKHEIALDILRDQLGRAYRTLGYHDGQVQVLQGRIDYELNERHREPEEKMVRDRDMHARERDELAERWKALWDSIAVLERDSAGGV